MGALAAPAGGDRQRKRNGVKAAMPLTAWWQSLNPAAQVLVKFLSAAAVIAPSSFYAGVYLRQYTEPSPTDDDVQAKEREKLRKLEISVQNLKDKIAEEQRRASSS